MLVNKNEEMNGIGVADKNYGGQDSQKINTNGHKL